MTAFEVRWIYSRTGKPRVVAQSDLGECTLFALSYKDRIVVVTALTNGTHWEQPPVPFETARERVRNAIGVDVGAM